MLDYKKFKKEMENRGHKLHKHGRYITIEPNNNINGYTKGFMYAEEIIEGYTEYLKFSSMKHFNTWIYSANFKIIWYS